MKRPQEIGQVHEKSLAKTLGGKVVPGSGNQWFAKLDVDTGSIIFSCKATNAKSLRLTTEMITEFQNAVHGLMGHPGAIGALSVWLDGGGERLVVLRENDFLNLCRGEIKVEFEPTKADKQRAKGKVPTLHRGFREQFEDGFNAALADTTLINTRRDSR